MIEHRDVVRPIRDHNRTSPRFVIEGILFPMLTLSEAEHGAYHNGNVSDVPCRSVSSTRIGSMDYTDAPTW